MHTFAISPPRATRHRAYIQQHLTDRHLPHTLIDCVDGDTLSDEQMAAACDLPLIRGERWLTRAAVACVLSHRMAYEEMLDQGLSHALIVEADIALPDDIRQLLELTAAGMPDNTLVLLNHATKRRLPVRATGPHNERYALVTPWDPQPSNIGSSAAYVIDAETAGRLLDASSPMRFAADNWRRYWLAGAFRSLQLVHPMPVRIAPFRSSLGARRRLSIASGFSQAVDRYRLPLFHQVMQLCPRRIRQAEGRNVVVTK